MSHYFQNDEKLDSKEVMFTTSLFNMQFKFLSDKGTFSYGELDYGSKLLIETVTINQEQTLLDIGTGIGVIGIALKKKYPTLEVTMTDVNLRALNLANKNAKLNNVDVKIFESDLYSNIDKKFDLIISNPPIRTGKKVIYTLYKEAFLHLNEKGSLWIVVRVQQGAKSTVEYLKTIFNTVIVVEKSKGFYIIKASK